MILNLYFEMLPALQTMLKEAVASMACINVGNDGMMHLHVKFPAGKLQISRNTFCNRDSIKTR